MQKTKINLSDSKSTNRFIGLDSDSDIENNVVTENNVVAENNIVPQKSLHKDSFKISNKKQNTVPHTTTQTTQTITNTYHNNGKQSKKHVKYEVEKVTDEDGWNYTKKLIKEKHVKEINKELIDDKFEENHLSQIDENTMDENEDKLGNNLFLGSFWTVWAHRTDCNSWTEDSYKHIYKINSIGSFWRFFNNFHMLDKHANQFFVMRNQIKPIWEDNENRKGGICSIKIDCYSNKGKMDIGSETMICMCLLLMNETLIPNNSEVNGISYSIKNKSVLIKVWYKDHKISIESMLPKSFLNQLESCIRNIVGKSINTHSKRNERLISIQCKPIRPEDDENYVEYQIPQGR